MVTPYADASALASTAWVADHIGDPAVRVVEVDFDPVSNYFLGHLRGASLMDWRRDLNDPLTRDVAQPRAFEKVLGDMGVGNETTLVLYGDLNNWFAAFAFWVCEYYGFKRLKLMDGGRRRWLMEDREMTKEVPKYEPRLFRAAQPDESLRAYMPQVKEDLGADWRVLVDVRSPKEYRGEILAPPEYPTEMAQRGGHIPGAVNVPWSSVLKGDGTFKPVHELVAMFSLLGVTADKEVITYCRIGERSSHMWFVLKHLLGFPRVKNYDGSWAEWGNAVKNPVER
ncbi:MAG TPA: sulfurtransferase [Conexivisphaerales archaeon]|nr:sulfurtransferase [Conexivisphaerales archaeon]